VVSPRNDDPYATFSMGWRNVSAWVWRILGRVFFRVEVTGREHLPAEGAVLIVANHASFLDPPLVGAFSSRPMHFLARATLARIPLMGPWMKRMGVVLLPRNSTPKDALRTVLLGLEQQRVVCIFPEGTRSPNGTVRPFQGGVEFLVKRTKATVVPVGLGGTGRALPKGAWFPRPYKCRVHWGEPWPADRVLAPGGGQALRARVAELAGAVLSDAAEGPGSGGPNSNHTDSTGGGSSEPREVSGSQALRPNEPSTPRSASSPVEGGSSGAASAAPGLADGPPADINRVFDTPIGASLGVAGRSVS